MHSGKSAGIRGVFSLVAVAAIALPTFAAPIPLGTSGWGSEVVDGTLNNSVVDDTNNDRVVIEIVKEFTDPWEFGAFPPIEIAFTQIADDASTVPSIVIDDESITNMTGDAWTDYHWAVIDSGQAWFNVPQMANIDTSPFNTQSFSGMVGGDPNKMMNFNVEGGVVPNGGQFNPGLLDGALWIDTDLSSANDVTFNFKQFPTNPAIPEPSTMMLMIGVGSMFVARRRR